MDNKKFLGCLLLACKNLNYSKEQARNLIGELSVVFESASEEKIDEGFKWLSNDQENNPELQQNDSVIKPKIKVKPRKITRLPDGYQSELSKENERLIKFLRNYYNPPWK